MDKLNHLTTDVLVKILVFLRSSDVHKFLFTSKSFYSSLIHDDVLWKDLCDNGIGKNISIEVLKQIENRNDTTNKSKYTCQQYRQASRVLEGIQRSTHLKLKRINVSSNDDASDSSSLRMEGHAACTIYERFIVIVGGWGPDQENIVHVLDGMNLPQLRKLSVKTIGCPQFKYGFTVVKDPNSLLKNRLYMYGGCQTGGYGGDCRDFYSIDIHFFQIDSLGNKQSIDDVKSITDLDFENNRIVVTATYTKIESNRLAAPISPSSPNSSSRSNNSNDVSMSANDTDYYIPTTRGYHSAVIMNINGHTSMLIWGGLSHHKPISVLEIYDFVTQTWRKVPSHCIQGKEPVARFGHSCNLIGDNQLIFIGGSDGNDLLRNGKELRDIHVLTIKNYKNEDNIIVTIFEWSIPMNNYASFPFSVVPGRCHCITQVNPYGSKLITFGGGAKNSNAITVFDLKQDYSELPTPTRKQPILPLHEVAEHYTRAEEEQTDMVIQINTPQVYALADVALPAKRTSAVAVCIGKCIMSNSTCTILHRYEISCVNRHARFQFLVFLY